MIDVVQGPLTFLETEQIFGCCDQIFLFKDARFVFGVQIEFLRNLVSPHSSQVVALGVKKQALEQSTSVGCCGRITRAKSAINVFESLFLVGRGILLKTFDNNPLINTGIHNLDLLETQFGNFTDHCCREWFESARYDSTFVQIKNIFDEHHVLDVIHFGSRFHRDFLDIIEEPKNVGIGPIAQGPEKGGGQEFSPTLFAVEVNEQQVVGIKLSFIPGPSVRDDPERMHGFAVGVLRSLKSQTWRAMQLADDHSLSAIDDKTALGGNQRQFAHENLLLLGPLLIPQTKNHMERSSEGDPFPEALQPIELGLADLVVTEFENTFAIITLDRKNFIENSLKPKIFTFLWVDLRLQEFRIGVVLHFDQVRRCDHLFDFSEVDSLRSFGWHSDL